MPEIGFLCLKNILMFLRGKPKYDFLYVVL